MAVGYARMQGSSKDYQTDQTINLLMDLLKDLLKDQMKAFH